MECSEEGLKSRGMENSATAVMIKPAFLNSVYTFLLCVKHHRRTGTGVLRGLYRDLEVLIVQEMIRQSWARRCFYEIHYVIFVDSTTADYRVTQPIVKEKLRNLGFFTAPSWRIPFSGMHQTYKAYQRYVVCDDLDVQRATEQVKINLRLLQEVFLFRGDSWGSYRGDFHGSPKHVNHPERGEFSIGSHWDDWTSDETWVKDHNAGLYHTFVFNVDDLKD